MPKSPSSELATWAALNEALMAGDIKLAERLLAEELKGKRRKTFMLRIHSRINWLRAQSERAVLMKKVS
jgi:superfamily I DNA and RNA helicase